MPQKNSHTFKELDHTADVGLEIFGDNLNEVFSNALFGMLHILYTDIKVEPKQIKRLNLVNNSLPDLLVEFLSEINFLILCDHFVPGTKTKITIEKDKDLLKLNAELAGENSVKFQNFLNTEIKAVTYHQLEVTKKENGYYAKVIFDI